jgi:AraC-like DNA-binding protein
LSQPYWNKCLYLIQQATKEIETLKPDSGDLLRAILYHLLVLLNRLYADHFTLQGTIYTNVALFKFRVLLEQHYTKLQRVVDYSDLLKISQVQLNKLCKQYAGQTAQKLIHAKIITEAKRLISYSSLSIAEIGYRLNFSDPANFNRFFKKYSGISPQQYRKQK